MEDVVLFIRTSGGLRQRHYSDLSNNGIRLWCCDYENKSDRFPSFENWIVCEKIGNMKQEALFILNYFDHKPKPKAVLSFDEFGVEIAAFLCENWNLPGLGYQFTANCRNKVLFRKFLEASALPSVKCHYMNLNECNKKTLEIQYPCVIKPTSGAGSHFVKKLYNQSDLEEAIGEFNSLLKGPIDSAWEWNNLCDREKFMVEEYIDGREIDADVLVIQGHIVHICISDNFVTSEPSFLELGGFTPSTLNISIQNRILNLLEQIFDAGCKRFGTPINGCFHTELKIDSKNRIIPIEINCRLGGAETWLRDWVTYGVDLARSATEIARGNNPCIESFGVGSIPRNFCCSLNLVPKESGVISQFRIPDSLMDHPGFGGMRAYLSAGDSVNVPPHGFQYMGWIMYKGSSFEDCIRNTLTLQSQVEVVIRSRNGGTTTWVLPQEVLTHYNSLENAHL